LVEPGDHAALAEKIRLLLNDAQMRQRMGTAAAAFAAQFAPANIAEQWEKIYEDISRAASASA
jgi:glycosyltransferase involved in cell wall biosynthesis